MAQVQAASHYRFFITGFGRFTELKIRNAKPARAPESPARRCCPNLDTRSLKLREPPYYKRAMKPRHAAAFAALLGLFVPLLCEGAFWIFHLGPDWSGLLLLVWPSSIQLIVLQGRDPWFVVVMAFAISISINAFCTRQSAGLSGLFILGCDHSKLGDPRSSN